MTRKKAASRRTHGRRAKHTARRRPPTTSTPVFEAFAIGLKPGTIGAQRADEIDDP